MQRSTNLPSVAAPPALPVLSYAPDTAIPISLAWRIFQLLCSVPLAAVPFLRWYIDGRSWDRCKLVLTALVTQKTYPRLFMDLLEVPFLFIALLCVWRVRSVIHPITTRAERVALASLIVLCGGSIAIFVAAMLPAVLRNKFDTQAEYAICSGSVVLFVGILHVVAVIWRKRARTFPWTTMFQVSFAAAAIVKLVFFVDTRSNVQLAWDTTMVACAAMLVENAMLVGFSKDAARGISAG